MRVVLLTGAAGGLGSAMTKALLGDGHAVAAVDRNADLLARLRASNEAAVAEERLRTIAADVASESDCSRAVGETVSGFGRLEALVNNAGIGASSFRHAITNRPSIEEVTPEIWDRFFAINVRGPMLLMRAALPHLRAAKWGRVVNITTSYRTMLNGVPYGVTKSALELMSAIWAAELAADGIMVAVLVPGGPTDTPFVGNIDIPREKMLRPDIMGPPVRWLVSDASNGFSGKRIIAARWDAALPPEAAAAKSSRAIAWPELTADAVWPSG